MYSEYEQKIPLKRAILYVLLSVFVIWGTFFLAYIVHQAILKKRQRDPRYNIVALIQTCPQKEHLENWQLAELLDLSCDRPQNLYAFDPALAARKLLQSPVIKRADLRRQPPGIVHVDYAVRTPCAMLSDFSNVAIDREGYCFPLMPYFRPKKLPEIYLGSQNLSYEHPLDSPEAKLAFAILSYCEEKGMTLTRIDTHKAYALSAGLQEVVIVLREGALERFLRIPTQEYKKSLDASLVLKTTLDQIHSGAEQQIIDLRSPSIALVK